MSQQVSAINDGENIRNKNGQAFGLVFFQSEMHALRPPQLSRMSRGVVLHPRVLSLPDTSPQAPAGSSEATSRRRMTTFPLPALCS